MCRGRDTACAISHAGGPPPSPVVPLHYSGPITLWSPYSGPITLWSPYSGPITLWSPYSGPMEGCHTRQPCTHTEFMHVYSY